MAQSITLEEGECLTLSPDSARYRKVYQQAHPRSADEVRELLGLSPEATKGAQEAGVCCQPGSAPAATAAAEDLDAEDEDVRANARALTYRAFNAFVYGTSPATVAHMKPAFDRYLEVNKAVINIALLQDIEVANGATLTISASTHVIRARKVIIHGNGRIVCAGSTSFKIVSLEGTHLHVKPVGGVQAVSQAAMKVGG